MSQVRITTEVAATPEEVRAIILDFNRYSEWHTSFIESISPTSSNTSEQKLYEGETLDVKVNGVKLVPIIKSNSPTEFSWYGSTFGGAFAGKHYFQFLDSHITPGGTTFVHGEDYDGWMTWMFGNGLLGIGRKKVVRMFDRFSKDVKKRAESLKELRKGITETQNDPWVKL